MANGFVVTKDDWDHMTPAQQSWMTFNAVQAMDDRVKKLEGRSLYDKFYAGIGGVIGGACAYIGLKLGG